MARKHDHGERAGESRTAPNLYETLRAAGVWILLALVLGVLIGIFAARHFGGPPPSTPPQANATRETPPAPSLEQRAKAVDEAVLRALRSVRAESRPHVAAVETRGHEGRDYRFQSVLLPLDPAEADEFGRRLVKELAALPGVQAARATSGQWDIALDGLPTHVLRLEPPAPPPPPAKGRLALVIDDMGEDVAFAQGLAALEVPVAFSIWPHSAHREAVLKIAKARGREILVHMPMEPKGYPKVAPGGQPLLLAMNAEQIRDAMRDAMAKVPGAIGLNNHMGSQFTENVFGMHAALTSLKDAGLFFLDSRTTPDTVGEREARRVGLRYLRRDVFLDNEQKVPAILDQLRKADNLARKNGQAIAIGHPHPETLAAIRQWLKEKGADVHVVPLSMLPQR